MAPVCTKAEVVMAIKKMRTERHLGRQHHSRSTKADPDLTANQLVPLFNKIWEENSIPTEWSKGSL